MGVSTGVSKHLGNVEHPLPQDGKSLIYRNTFIPLCVIIPNLVALGQTMYVWVDGPKIWDAGNRHIGMWGVAKTRSSPTCYRTKLVGVGQTMWAWVNWSQKLGC